MSNSLLSYNSLVQLFPYVLFLGIVLCVPEFASKYVMGLVCLTLMYAIGSISWDLLLGYTGLMTFGHAYGWGLGYYAVGVLVGKGITESFWIVLGVAVLMAIIAGAIFAFLALRTRGIYLGFITLALCCLLQVVTIKWTFLGGENGLTGISRPWSLGDVSYYYLVISIFIICFLLMRWITASWFGKVLIGIRENESRVIMLGFDPWIHKFAIFVTGGVFAAIGGVLCCYYVGIASPEAFGLVPTFYFMFSVLIGGRGTLVGPLIGTFFVVFSSNYLSSFTEHWLLVLGIIFILVVMIFKKGIGGYLLEWLQKIKIRLSLPLG